MKELLDLVEKEESNLSVRKQCQVLEVNRSSVYYAPVGESRENLELMNQMDRIFTEEPTFGVIRMQDELSQYGFYPNIKRIRRLARKMGIEPIYPKRNLSRLGKAKYIHPYLLRNLNINRPNQAWAIDISYIPMKSGFMYLTAIIDIYSRFIVGWQLSNSLDKESQTRLLKSSIDQYGTPGIINSDQGSQYTSEHWVSFVKEHDIRISMDGKGRATDNCFIERFFRTIKQDYVYLYPANDGWELYEGVQSFIKKYNNRKHQGIGRTKPINRYQQAA